MDIIPSDSAKSNILTSSVNSSINTEESIPVLPEESDKRERGDKDDDTLSKESHQVEEKEEEEEEEKKQEPKFSSPKEKECWQLYQKMCDKGLTVSYDTILR